MTGERSNFIGRIEREREAIGWGIPHFIMLASVEDFGRTCLVWILLAGQVFALQTGHSNK